MFPKCSHITKILINVTNTCNSMTNPTSVKCNTCNKERGWTNKTRYGRENNCGYNMYTPAFIKKFLIDCSLEAHAITLW